ncbi:MAG TPA: hypothetical protein DCP92_22895 [Nitrospiraceae bacterium]|jgi:chemotaxis protein MotA|nr:hypothetical protein [Nitrospiraceae bacterium]
MNPILGIALVIGVFSFLITTFRDIGITMLFNPDALFVVVGGTTIALFVSFPFPRIRNTVLDVIETFKDHGDRATLTQDILQIARAYRRADIRGLESRIKGMRAPLLRLGTNLLISHYTSEDMKNIMKREVALRMVNYNFSQNMLKTIARLTPSFGLAGTVISLIRMFKHLQSVDAIAPLMAVALMSTFYGVILSNLIMLPLAAKLKDKAIVSEALMHITIEGMVAINNMDNPLRIEEMITGYQEQSDTGLSGRVPVSMSSSASGV